LIGVIVLSAIVVVMLAGFLWFYMYSRTLAWGQSDTRKALLNMMIVVGPIFGMHYKKEPPEPTSISAPAQDDEDDSPVVSLPPSESE
jgi:drug/metabolite transporter (DMT)-like permease